MSFPRLEFVLCGIDCTITPERLGELLRPPVAASQLAVGAGHVE